MASKVLLAVFLATLIAGVVLSKPDLTKRYRRETRQHLPQASVQVHSPTPCQNAGFSGCCDLTTSYCYIGYLNCYCDLSCHLYNDCCPDINAISCTSPGQTTCSNLPPLANGRIAYTPYNNPKRPGTIAHYRCNTNYIRVGYPTRVCQYNLTWGGSEPVCKKTCGKLAVPANGAITYEPSYPSSRKPVRTVAIYRCSNGYILAGNDMQTCQESGDTAVWSGESPYCRVYSCRIQYSDTQGCCNDSFCYVGTVATELCSCSADCFISEHIKCCPDIGCPRQTCAQAGLEEGCCTWNDTNTQKGCYVPGGNCFCDEECRNEEDCCSDVDQARTCPSGTVSDTANQALTEQSMGTRQYSQGLSGQSVRTRTYSRAQVASRPPGDQNRKLADKQETITELASELRSLSQTQERSNEQQRTEWEAILKELQEIQKNKKD